MTPAPQSKAPYPHAQPVKLSWENMPMTAISSRRSLRHLRAQFLRLLRGLAGGEHLEARSMAVGLLAHAAP